MFLLFQMSSHPLLEILFPLFSLIIKSFYIASEVTTTFIWISYAPCTSRAGSSGIALFPNKAIV